jgi:hypothetical protein
VHETFNQRLLAFFKHVVCEQILEPVVIFLDEIDSTLKLSFTDDLFTAIRGMYNERSLVPAYERIIFCLLGVATPTELIKDRRTTPYNVGRTLELRDFDKNRDDLTALAGSLLAPDREAGARMLDRLLYWTGGHPYLTVKLCADLRDAGATTPDSVDDHVRAVFANLDRVTRDDHFHYIVRFVDTRLSQGIASLNLYQRILRGARERDQASLAHAELKLSGLVKRDPDGFLVVRNRIYQRLFDERWVQSTQPKRTAVRYRQLGIAASVALFITVGAMTAWQVLFVQPSISELNVREMLAEMNISIGTAEGGVIHAVFPPRATQADVEDAIPLLQALGSVTELDLTRTQIKDVKPLARLSTLKVLKLSGTPTKDVTPLEALTGLEALDLSGTQVSSLMPLAKLPALVSLSLGSQDVPLRDTYNLILGPQASSSWAERLEDYGTKPVRFQAAPVSDISPLADMPSLQELDLSHTDIADLSPLAGLAALRILDLDHTPVKDVNPLADLPELKMLELDNTAVEDVTPLSGLTALGAVVN